MSTFNGRIEGIETLIAVDYFLEDSHGCQIFLLTHYHSDHIRGLNYDEHYKREINNSYTTKFQEMFDKSSDKLIYCSALTKFFLEKNEHFSKNADRIITLELNTETKLIERGPTNNSPIYVTSLPSGHCLGAVMFLIKHGSENMALYTGDICLKPSEFERIIRPYMCARDEKIIVDLYLDTTFALPHKGAIEHGLEIFPSQEICINAIIRLIEEWRREDPGCRIVLEVPYYVGIEKIYISLFKKFNLPTMIDDDYYRRYFDKIEETKPCEEVDLVELQKSVISFSRIKNDTDWFLHACWNFSEKRVAKNPESKCTSVRIFDENVRIIKPCSLNFLVDWSSDTKMFEEDGVPYITGDMKKANKKYYFKSSSSGRITKIFFYEHCSPEELRGIWSLIKNKINRFKANVVRVGLTTEKILEWIDSPEHSVQSVNRESAIDNSVLDELYEATNKLNIAESNSNVKNS